MGYEDQLAELEGRQEHKHTVLPWSLASIEMLPSNEGGVYAIWCAPTGKCVYVGYTDDSLRGRVKKHWGLRTNEKLARWIRVFGQSLILCYHRCGPGTSRTIERRLIRTWQPEANDADK